MNKYKVSIFGETYVLTSDESETQVAAAAGQVDVLMREIASYAQGVDARRIAVLVALRLASQLQNLESHLEHKRQEASKLADLIDRELSSACL